MRSSLGTVLGNTARPACLAVIAALVLAACETVVPSARPFELGDRQDAIGGDDFAGPGTSRLFAGLAVGSGFIVGGERVPPNGLRVEALVLTSPDGTSWEPATSPGGGFDQAIVGDLVTNGDVIVALGEERIGNDDDDIDPTLIWRSSDGREWERLDPLDPDVVGQSIAGIVGDPTGFVAWGTNCADAAQVLVSKDAIDWTPVDMAPFEGAMIRDIVRARDRYVAIGSTGDADDCTGVDVEPARAWWSPDAITWHVAEIDKGAELERAFSIAGGLFAVGTPSGCGFDVIKRGYWHSDDGRSWSLVEEDRSLMEVFASDGNRVVAWDRTTEDFSYTGPGPMQASLDGVAWLPIEIVDTAKRASDTFVIGKDGILVILRDLSHPPMEDAGVQYIPFR